jgi:hyperosmotically inducible protein
LAAKADEGAPSNGADALWMGKSRVGRTEETIMKTRVALSCVVACSMVGLVPLIAMAEPASEMARPEPAVVIKDSAITSSIKARLAADPVRGFGHIRVDTDDHGVVTLKGHARTQGVADRAISIAKDTEGVREVHSAIKIKNDD